MDNTVHEARVRLCSMNNLPCPGDEFSARQRSWDAPGITRDWTTIWNYSMSDLDKARLLAIKAAHSSDWLFALPISSCCLRLCDETIRVGVGLRLGLKLCEAHTCPCGALVSARGTHLTACHVRGVLGGLLAIIKSMILYRGPSNAAMFRPP